MSEKLANRRSPERAAQVLDRAASMRSFKPGWADRDVAGDRMKAPNRGPVSVDYNALDRSQITRTGIKDIPLKSLVTDQPTVSLRAVKDKLLNPNAKASSAVPTAVLDPKTGKYVLTDGVHRLGVAKALGSPTMRVATAELAAQPQAVVRSASSSQTSPGNAFMKVGIGVAGATAAVSAYDAYDQSRKTGASVGDAAIVGAAEGAKSGATSTAALTAMSFAAKAAPRAMAVLGPVGMALGAGAMAVGAYKGYQDEKSGYGAVKGAFGIETRKPVTAHSFDAADAKSFTASEHAHAGMRAPPAQGEQGDGLMKRQTYDVTGTQRTEAEIASYQRRTKAQ